MSAGAWSVWLTVAGVLIVAGIYRIRKYGHAEGGEVTPLDDLMDGPGQIGDDTLAMVADMWDSIEEADANALEVDDTAAEADMVTANGPEVLAHGRAIVGELEEWLKYADLEAWLGERGWL